MDLFQRAHALGLRHFVLTQDTHHPETPEFEAWPVHCVRGTDEAETIPGLQALPFANLFTVIEKNSLHPGVETEFDAWLDAHPALRTAIVVGNCTDLCVYQLAMHLRLRSQCPQSARGVGDRAGGRGRHLRSASGERRGNRRLPAPGRFLPPGLPVSHGSQRHSGGARSDVAKRDQESKRLWPPDSTPGRPIAGAASWLTVEIGSGAWRHRYTAPWRPWSHRCRIAGAPDGLEATWRIR